MRLLDGITDTTDMSLSCMEKEMANHSSTLAWKIPWTEEPGGLPSLGQEDPLEEVIATHSSIFA